MTEEERANSFGPLTRRMIFEEMLGALHIMAAIMLFYGDADILAWLFVARACFDEFLAVKFALLALKHERIIDAT